MVRLAMLQALVILHHHHLWWLLSYQNGLDSCLVTISPQRTVELLGQQHRSLVVLWLGLNRIHGL